MKQPDKMIYLSRDTLDSLNITTDEVISSIEHLIHGQQASRVWNTPKSVIQPADGRYMMSTLSAADDPPYLVVKSVILNPKNPEQGLPQINGLIMVLDSDTGVPLAVVDGNWVTAIRTAGASAVVARRLAKADSEIITFIGCGVQAHSHLRLFADLFPLKEVRAFGRGKTNRDALCQAAEDRGLVAIRSESAQDAVQDADIVVSSVTLTVKIDPFVDPRWLKPGAFVSSTDVAVPWIREGMSAFDQIIIDDLEQESAMPDPMVESGLVSGDLSGLVGGKIQGRMNNLERIAFVFRAVVLGDLALAGLALDKARANSAGLVLE
jgi:ornithine cyclodeaminase/alanine dehydrogenase